MKISSIILAAALATGMGAQAIANEYAEPLKALAEEARAWVSDPVIIAAIKARNAEIEQLKQDEIDALDQEWRGQVGQEDAPLITAVAETDASAQLVVKRDESEGLLTEIFVMDKKGLNVAMSDTTSDYWQGDESKYQETFLKGAEAVHISDIELDESTQTYQSQVSFTIVDPESGEPIGAVTLGVDVGYLE